LQSIIDKCRICGTEGKTIEHIISSCTVSAQSEYKKRYDIFAKSIHMNLAVNLFKNTQPHYSYTPESCLENDNYKLYFDRTVVTDIHIKHNRPDIIILNKQQKQAYLLDIAVSNSHNITQTYNTKINKYLELSVAMRNLWCLEKNSILPLIISVTGILPQSLFKNLKILDLGNTLVVEIQKGILLYSCHILRKFLNIDTEHNKIQQSQNVEARRRLISTALL
jgi:galactitol-specific phosphotransferase system IIB component